MFVDRWEAELSIQVVLVPILFSSSDEADKELHIFTSPSLAFRVVAIVVNAKKELCY